MQVSPEQQPSGQLCAPHGIAAQAPASQEVPAPQAEQELPPVPHARSLGAVTQVLAWQQPEQFEGPQVSGTHAPWSQVSPDPHGTHVPPSTPHAALDGVTHAPD